METIRFKWDLVKFIFKESWRGKGLNRILVNYCLANQKKISLSGRIIDLGAGKSMSSYHRFLNFNNPYKLDRTDYYEAGEGVLKLDLEEAFADITDNCYDSILCFNVLEHIYNFNNVASESYRILKTGGLFVGSVPFLVNYHPDPNDYFRFSVDGLKKIFSTAEFKEVKLIFVGFGPFISAYVQLEMMVPKLLKPFFVVKAIILDLLFLKIKKNYYKRYPLDYIFICQK